MPEQSGRPDAPGAAVPGGPGAAVPGDPAEAGGAAGLVGPVDGRLVPRFAGAASFARLPEIDRVPDYDVAILGVPFDNGTSYRPGARFGPMAVRQASRHLRPGQRRLRALARGRRRARLHARRRAQASRGRGA